jgi:hypothetical protein
MGFLDLLFGNKKKNEINKSVKKNTEIHNRITSSLEIVDHSKPEIDPIYTKKLSNGMFPGEIVLLDWIEGKTVDANFPGYFEYNYGINAKNSAFKLVHEGYMKYATPIESLPSLKVTQLKEMLKTKKLKVSGNKKELVERIQENFSFEEVSNHIESALLKLTQKGEEVFKEFYYIVPAHKNDSKDGIYNVGSAIKHVKGLKYKPNNGDISWALFQKALLKYQDKFQHGLVRNVFTNMAFQLFKEKRYRDALENYFRVFIIDLSGLNNGLYLSHPKYILLAPGITTRITKTIEILELNEGELKAEFSIAWSRIRPSLLFHYLDENTCFQCLLASFNDQNEFIKEELKHAFDQLDKNTFEKTYKISFPVYYED